MLHLALEEFDFARREMEQAIDAVVDFRFGVGQLAVLASAFAAVLGDVGFPFVGCPRVLEGLAANTTVGSACFSRLCVSHQLELVVAWR
jgi:hypothetical protein